MNTHWNNRLGKHTDHNQPNTSRFHISSVADELLRAPEDDPAHRAIEGGSFKIIETPAPPAQILAWDLGQGETAVLSYALAHPKWIAVLDEAPHGVVLAVSP